MQLFRNAVLVTNRQPIASSAVLAASAAKMYGTVSCWSRWMLPALFGISRKTAAPILPDDILWNMAELKELSPGFHVFVLRTVNDSGMCGMLRDDRCTIYSVRPHTLQTVPIYGGALPGGASYQVVFVYGAAPSLWLRLRHCTGMAKKKYVR